jgi:hypothetical protein
MLWMIAYGVLKKRRPFDPKGASQAGFYNK